MSVDGMSFRPSDRLRMLLPRERRATGTSRVIPVLSSLSAAARKIVVPICDFEGFYPPESENDLRFAWTKGTAVLTCHFMEPVSVRHLWLPVYSAKPGGGRVKITIDRCGEAVFPKVVRNRVLRVPLGRKVKSSYFRFTLECETFEPDDYYRNGDHRSLGIALRRIILGRNLIACCRGLQGEVHLADPWDRGKDRQVA